MGATLKGNGGSGDKVQAKFYPSIPLYEAVGRAAEAAGIPISEWIGRVLAEKLGQPELGVVHRKVPGRKRKQRLYIAY